MSLRTKYVDLIKNVGIFAISNFSVKAITFLILPLYTYYLSTKEYAVIDLVSTTAQLVLPFLSLCIIDALLRFGISKEHKLESIFTNSIVIVAGGCLILPVFVIIFRNFIDIGGVEVYFYIIYTLQVFNSLFSSFCKAINKVKHMAVISMITSISIVVCNLFLVAGVQWGIKGYFVSVIAGNLLGLLMYLKVCDVRKYLRVSTFDKKILKEMLYYSVPLIPNAVFWWINTSLDKYALTAMTTLSIVGLYSVANKIPTIITTVTSIFTQAWNISAFQAFGDDDGEEFYNNTYVLYRNLLLICTCGVILFSKVFAKILFSKGFYEAWIFIPLLTTGVYYNSLNSFMGSLFTAGKKTKHIFYTTALGSVINIIFNVILIKMIGPQGAAAATLVSYLVVWLARSVSVNKIMKFHVRYWEEAVIFLLLLLECSLIINGGMKSVAGAAIIVAVLCLYGMKGIYKKVRRK